MLKESRHEAAVICITSLELCQVKILARAGDSLGKVKLDVPLAELLAQFGKDADDDFLEKFSYMAAGHDWYEVVPPDQAWTKVMLRGPIRGVCSVEEVKEGDPYIVGGDVIALGYALRYGPESWKAYIREWLGLDHRRGAGMARAEEHRHCLKSSHIAAVHLYLSLRRAREGRHHGNRNPYLHQSHGRSLFLFQIH